MTEIYRTALHSRKERDIGDHLAEIAQGTFVHYPKTSTVNGLIVGSRGEARRLIEIKTRTCAKDDYTTTMLAMSKYKSLIALKKLTKVPVSFAVVFTDCIGLIAVDSDLPKLGETEMAGRYDRPDDPKAEEECLMIPTDLMKLLPLPEGYDV